ncbi:MAG: nodulation protein NfeD [Gaiellaceae bacterium MAG52_C11]|nr:nodulation protein NfeD [Candidatus Gaiellasilicea maunaloa]
MHVPLSRGLLLSLVVAAAALLLSAPAEAGGAARVLVAEFENDVNPVTQEYLLDTIERGEREGYAAVVIELDTPGGLGSSMRAIVKGILAAEVPVVVYVAPAGSSADSAGAVIGMAADVLAMAPQTNIGSSTPISTGGEDFSKDLRRKIVNDAAAYIGELARENGRNVAEAREMVTEASNLGAREALRLNVVDVIADDYASLFRQIDGTEPPTKPDLTISTGTSTTIERIEMSTWKRILDLLIDPNIVALMLSIGLIGIVVELWNPGLVFPGTVGAISLVVGLYGLQVLPVSAAGLLLMILAAAFFVAEAFIVSHGALSVAGAVTFVIGALLLFDPAGEAYQVSIQLALAIALTMLGLFGFGLTKAATARAAPVAVGTHRLVGEPAQVRAESLVFVDGELWRARSADGSPLRPGTRVRVESVQQEELQLVVASPDPAPERT